MNRLIQIIIFFIPIWQTLCHAFENDNTDKYQKDIQVMIAGLQTIPKPPIGERINRVSEKFLHHPYLLSALGEGLLGQFDRYPLYRTDAFDCETFVDTVLALAHAKDLKNFEKNILDIRYQNGKADFLTRNHFTNIDWNAFNQKKSFIQDMTPSFTWRQKPIYKESTTFINKKNWYQKLSIKTIRIANLSYSEQFKKLKQLQQNANQNIKNGHSTITYLPIDMLFDKHQHPRQDIFNQIPQGAIIEIVRPQWDLQDKIGTQLDVSHLGFAIWKGHILYFRNASSLHHRVIDENLTDYLKKTLKSPTIKGIHIEKTLEKDA